MKYAFQTIAWRIKSKDEVPRMLYDIASAGFTGVEIAQPPALLPSAEELAELLQHYGLQLAGLSGGSVRARVEYCGTVLRPDYLYVENVSYEEHETATKAGMTLALHPHKYKQGSDLDSVREHFTKYPSIRFLPDTAHLHAMNIDLVNILDEFREKLIAVHLKDWKSTYGRSFYRYARGFVDLGKGEARVKEVYDKLREVSFDGWVVVERDFNQRGPQKSLDAAAAWLQANAEDIQPRILEAPRPPVAAEPREQDFSASATGYAFATAVFSATMRESLYDFADDVLQAVRKHVQCDAASIWEVSPSICRIGLFAESPSGLTNETHIILPWQRCLCGLAIDSRAVRPFRDIRDEYEGKSFQCQEIIDKGMRSMISIPVLNSYNPNHVELVLNLYSKEIDFFRNAGTKYDELGTVLALAYEAVLGQVCQVAAMRVERAVATAANLREFFDNCVREVSAAMDDGAVSLFLVDLAGDRLVLAASTHELDWKGKAKHYKQGDGSSTSWVWEHKDPKIVHRGGEAEAEKLSEPRSQEVLPDSNGETPTACLIYPLIDARGKVHGTLRCRKVQKKRGIYDESDIAIAESICQAVVPNLVILMEDERRAKLLDRLTHEIKVPIFAVQGAVDILEMEAQYKKYTFRHDFTGDIRAWCGVMRQHLHKIDRFRFTRRDLKERLVPQPEATLLYADVFAPVSTQLGPLLRNRGFSAQSIVHDNFSEIPQLWVDRIQMQQVFFNLFGNAIKYAQRDPAAFHVEIETRRARGGYEISFCDNGMGIDVEDGRENSIFKEYVRSPMAQQVDVTGDGLGLYFVRQIIEAHGGTIHVKRRARPTEFVIWLPLSLSAKWKPIQERRTT